jgi:WD40 repeat protein
MIKVWVVKSGLEKCIMITVCSQNVHWLFPGKLCATAGSAGMIKVWVVKSGLEKCTLIGHKGAVQCLQWATWVSKHGNTYQRLVSGGEDKTVRVSLLLLPSIAQIILNNKKCTLIGHKRAQGGEDKTVRISTRSTLF